MSSNLLEQKFMSHGEDDNILPERWEKVQSSYYNHYTRDLPALNEGGIIRIRLYMKRDHVWEKNGIKNLMY